MHRVLKRLVAVGFVALFVAGCGSSGPAPVALPAPPTTKPPYTHAQVLGWVSTTLNNGVSLVAPLTTQDPYGQLFQASQDLSTACGVSAHELGQTSWSGQAGRSESALLASLTQIQALVAQHPAVAYGLQLRDDIQTMRQRLGALKNLGPS